jgi:micrococcal nuclease
MNGTKFIVPVCVNLITAVVVGMSLYAADKEGQDSSSPILALVDYVADGDTLFLNSGETVRLIGVDTPESHHPERPVEYFAAEAKAFLEQTAKGREVRLVYGKERYDKYGRLLAYAYLPDGVLINAEIIKAGCGFAYTRFPFELSSNFVRYETEARQAKRGMWAADRMAELRWVMERGRTPFKIYDLSNRKWAVEFRAMAKVCSSLEELNTELSFLRTAAYGLSDKDLLLECGSRGWKEIPAGKGVSE